MVTPANTGYGANNSLTGVYTAPASIVPAAFTGASPGLGALGSVALTGSFDHPGDSISAVFANSSTVFRVVYEGSYLAGGQPVHVFRPAATTLGVSAFAIHAEPIILIDRDITGYQFFPIELDRLAIVLAEGLATGCVPDIGSRVGPSMAAPLTVGREPVETVWNRLAERAGALGSPGSQGVMALTDQPDLRLLLDDGREIATCWHNEIRHLFQIPPGARPVRLLSRSVIPAGVIGPFVDDRRMLGVSVDRLVLWNGLSEEVMAVADLDLAGWHQNEGGRRWTNGNASLELPRADSDTFLDIHLAATLLYPRELPMAA